ncbi:glycosyltransferase [Variovorax sp. RTB1]|uniref:glycosyltransferase n=1 Tax=Variovorax sp. RTB1 TaxID=3048631 RepID=UPI002B223C10|nr:glycosyltransferase [Variovorax sp. RTB1]MEB0110444.1 glycosyltransferase [Variovorax sp. RTB1]
MTSTATLPAAVATPRLYRGQRIALIVPCYNEEAAIAEVIRGFRAQLPELSICVFDNNSTDRTAQIARDEGAMVVQVQLSGKGNVVRRMFADIEADIYVMTDGDATYDASTCTAMVDKLLDERLDMVVACRKTEASIAADAYRRGHQLGNQVLTGGVGSIFGGAFTDMLSGYRAFSRRFAKSFPALSRGFEIETELTVHALELRMPYGEIDTSYFARPEGSQSKLSTYKDGFRILRTILRLYVSERPMHCFGLLALVCALISVGLAIPILQEFWRDGLVPRLPTAVLCASIMILTMLSLVCGVILDSITRGRQEMKRLTYLSVERTKVNSDV